MKDLLIGVHSVREWLEADASRLKRLLVAPRPNERVARILRKAELEGIVIETVPMGQLRKLAGPKNPQGLVAEVHPFPYATLDGVLEQADSSTLLLGVDGVTDPHNLGAIIRSAGFFGASAVLLPRDKSAPITPVTERAAAGAAATLPICEVNSLRKDVMRLQKDGFRVIGSIVGPHPAPAVVDLTGPVLLLVGSEDKGIRPSIRRLCDAKTSIPSAGPASLNVSAFSSVLLYEAFRQRSAPIRSA